MLAPICPADWEHFSIIRESLCLDRLHAIWWKQTQSKVARASNLQVFQIAPEVAKALEPLCQRTMQLQVTIQDGEIWLRDATNSVQVAIEQIFEDQR